MKNPVCKTAKLVKYQKGGGVCRKILCRNVKYTFLPHTVPLIAALIFWQWKLHTALLRPCVCIYRPQEGLKRARSTHFRKEVGVFERRVQWSARQFPTLVESKMGLYRKIKVWHFCNRRIHMTYTY